MTDVPVRTYPAARYVLVAPRSGDDATREVIAVLGGPLSDAFEIPHGFPEGSVIVASDSAQVGWSYTIADGTFSAPPAQLPTAIDLARYAEFKQTAVLNGGISVDVGEGSKADVSTTDKGRGLVTSAVGIIDLATKLDQPVPTFPWINNDGTKLSLSGAQMQTIGLALGQFVQQTYGALGDATAGIASGEIKDFAAVDALPWPANG